MTRPKARKSRIAWAERFADGYYMTHPSKKEAQEDLWPDSVLVRVRVTELHPRKKARRGK